MPPMLQLGGRIGAEGAWRKQAALLGAEFGGELSKRGAELDAFFVQD